jgi:hypothetical protein
MGCPGCRRILRFSRRVAARTLQKALPREQPAFRLLNGPENKIMLHADAVQNWRIFGVRTVTCTSLYESIAGPPRGIGGAFTGWAVPRMRESVPDDIHPHCDCGRCRGSRGRGVRMGRRSAIVAALRADDPAHGRHFHPGAYVRRWTESSNHASAAGFARPARGPGYLFPDRGANSCVSGAFKRSCPTGPRFGKPYRHSSEADIPFSGPHSRGACSLQRRAGLRYGPTNTLDQTAVWVSRATTRRGASQAE